MKGESKRNSLRKTCEKKAALLKRQHEEESQKMGYQDLQPENFVSPGCKGRFRSTFPFRHQPWLTRPLVAVFPCRFGRFTLSRAFSSYFLSLLIGADSRMPWSLWDFEDSLEQAQPNSDRRLGGTSSTNGRKTSRAANMRRLKSPVPRFVRFKVGDATMSCSKD